VAFLNEAAVGTFSYSFLINNSQINGSTNTISNNANFTIRVGASLMSGGVASGG
jgi:hypothetical protein